MPTLLIWPPVLLNFPFLPSLTGGRFFADAQDDRKGLAQEEGTLQGEVQGDGTVVGAEDVVEDVGALDFVPEVFGDQEVVDAPAYVPFAGVHTVGPPGIFGFAGVEGAPGVYEACVKQLSHLGAFLVGETGVEVVCGGVLEVDLLVGHVHIAADNDAFAGREAAKVLSEGVLPLHTVWQAAQAVLGVGGIDVHQVELRKLQRNDAAFRIVLFDAYAVCDAQRMLAGVDCRSGVALLLGVVPVGLIAQEFQVQLPGLQLSLLQAYEVSVKGLEDVREALPGYGAEAVHVPTDEFHTIPGSIRHRPWCPLLLFQVS